MYWVYGKVLVVGVCGGGEKTSGAAPVSTRSVPDSSKMDPLLAKAEPISETGGASVTTCLRKGEKLLHKN